MRWNPTDGHFCTPPARLDRRCGSVSRHRRRRQDDGRPPRMPAARVATPGNGPLPGPPRWPHRPGRRRADADQARPRPAGGAGMGTPRHRGDPRRRRPVPAPAFAGDQPPCRDYTACVDGTGRELKLQLMPQELAAWFGVPVSADTTVHDVLGAQVHSDRPAAVEPLPARPAALGEAVVWGPASGPPTSSTPPCRPPAERPTTATVLQLLSAL